MVKKFKNPRDGLFKNLTIKYILKKSLGLMADRAWERKYEESLRSASKEAKVVNPEVAAMTKDKDFRTSWHYSDGSTLLHDTNSLHSHHLRPYQQEKPFDTWVRGIYFKDENEYHTRYYFPATESQELYRDPGPEDTNRSNLMQEKSFEALKNNRIIPQNAKHIKNSNDEMVSSKIRGKRFR
jgi:hypothetical protein